MAIDWSAAYESPTSLDAVRLIGTSPRRASLWTLVGVLGVILCGLPTLLVNIAAPWVLATSWALLVYAWLGLAAPWVLFCYAFATNWGQRPAEHWLRVWARSRKMPRTLEGSYITQYHADLRMDPHGACAGQPRAVVEVSTLNLRLADADTLAGHIKRLHAFYVGLKWPIQIVVRAWLLPDGIIVRRWFIAIMGPTDPILDGRIEDVIAGLKRAGLDGRRLNGDLFDTLQTCWSASPRETLTPRQIERYRDHAVVDGEAVRGFVLTKLPRILDPNWLAPLLDGDLAVDMSMWLDPISNSVELEHLSDRINEWETAQVLRLNQGSYRDPDIDDQIKDAQRTRLQLRRPGQLRVFQGTIAFAVRGPDLATMYERESLLLDQLREQIGPDAVLPIDIEQDRAPLFGVPTGESPYHYPQRIVTPALARSYPFSNSSLSMPSGVRCGTSKSSDRENRLDVWSLTNPHMAILATSGAGKGYWLKVFIWRLLLMFPQRRVWIIQAEKDEYSALAHSLPKTYVYKFPDVGVQERGAVIRIKSLEDIDDIWFYKPTRTLSGQQLTVYDLTWMEPADRGTATALLLRAIEEAASREKHETLGHVVVDELGIVLRDSVAAAAIEIAYRRFRSIPHRDEPAKVSRRGMIGVSQRPSDLLAREDGPGKVIADLSETHIYLRQKQTELRITKPKLKLSDEEADYLELADDGDGLLVAGRSRVAFHMFAEPEEHAMAKT